VKYNPDTPKRLWRKRRTWLIGTFVLAMFGGFYLLFLLVAPRIAPDLTLGKFQSIDPAKITLGEHQIIIPKIGVSIEYLEGKDASTLEKGSWWRYPERGNPEIGGNFILSAHRFNIGWTPEKTRAKSPFYNINQLNPGDPILIDYKGKRYTYEVSRRYKVDPNAISIEAPSTEAKLTLYSCTFKGSLDGREVIEAHLKS
jgi:sortase A